MHHFYARCVLHPTCASPSIVVEATEEAARHLEDDKRPFLISQRRATF